MCIRDSIEAVLAALKIPPMKGKPTLILCHTHKGLSLIHILLLPRLMGLDGVWLAVVAAEALAVAVAAACFGAKRKTYGY